MPIFSAKLHFRLHSGKIVEEKVKVRSHVTFVLKSTFLLKFYVVSTVMQTKIMRLGIKTCVTIDAMLNLDLDTNANPTYELDLRKR